jgi:hypothetical protein
MAVPQIVKKNARDILHARDHARELMGKADLRGCAD